MYAETDSILTFGYDDPGDRPRETRERLNARARDDAEWSRRARIAADPRPVSPAEWSALADAIAEPVQ